MSQIKFWRSLEQLKDTDTYRNYLHREFQEGASEQDEGVSRRTFLKLMGASAALAGLVGCGIRKPTQKIKPYVKRPEDALPGQAVYYATTVNVGGDSVGVLAKTNEGRPTKLEGNPAHSRSLGSLSAQLQALVLGLYDPDRLVFPKERVDGELFRKTWQDFSTLISQGVIPSTGEGVAVLTEAQYSPVFYSQLSSLRQLFPSISTYRYEPLNQDALYSVSASVFGSSVTPDYRFDKSKVIVSFASDFLGADPSAVIYSKRFTELRNPESGEMSRFYAFDSGSAITASKADHRIALKPSLIEPALWVLASALFSQLPVSSEIQSLVNKGASKYASLVDAKIIKAIVSDLSSNKGAGLVVVGPSQSQGAHALAAVINQALGNIGTTVQYRKLSSSLDPVSQVSSIDSLSRLTDALNKGLVKTVIILGGNPVYASPADLKFGESLSKAKLVIHLTESENETSQKSNWILPRAHVLESWGDLESLDGSVSLVQPLIRPLYDGKTDAEILSLLQGKSDTGYAITRQYYRNKSVSDSTWTKALHDGVVSGPATLVSVSVNPSLAASFIATSVSTKRSSDAIDLLITPSYSIWDGRFSNNGWLQELPDPVTKLTWDNAALMSLKTSEKLKLKDTQFVELKTADGHALKLPVVVVPGYSENTIGVSTGYGRTVVGRVGKESGFNVYALQTKASLFINSVTAKGFNEFYSLANTQNHGSMEGRPLIREASLAEYKKNPKFAKEMVHTQPLKSLFNEISYDTGYQWGMVIDLSRCTSCNACVTACQSENNIPIVGKDQVLNGREMHWIRVDRYFAGDTDNAMIVSQPVTCLQCENAPCEQVCPVAATVHSKEGLNDMVYNRCIGTRYCSNNCPVKVRRFNFFDYHQRNPQSVDKKRQHLFDYFKEPDTQIQKQFNPDVTVRMRGIMEKCTYCVQRINEARAHSKNEGRLIQDGEVLTACQQTCPSNAIVFGNILDATSVVSQRRNIARDYHILEELHLKPRTSYLASIRNPHPDLVSSEAAHVSKH
jgi:MoCo/4Fe-4S cofactor protein with predicted Tat translocation signal